MTFSRKMGGAALAAVALVTAAACSGPGSGAAPAGGSEAQSLPQSCSAERPLLGVALPNTVNPYYVAMRQSFIDNGERNGFEVNVAIANDNDSNQLAQVQAFIQQGVCAVALNPVTSGPGAAMVNALSSAGIPVITVNIDADRDQVTAGGGRILQYVGADQREGGAAMARTVVEDLGDTAPVVGFAGEPDETVTVERDEAFQAEMTSLSPQAQVVASVDTNVDPQVALRSVTEMLQGHRDINVVWASTGPAAVGSIQAIRQLGLTGKVTLYAFCAADTATDDVLYRGCAAQQPTEYARIVTENVAAFVRGQTLEPEVLLPVKVFSEGQKPAADELG